MFLSDHNKIMKNIVKHLKRCNHCRHEFLATIIDKGGIYEVDSLCPHCGKLNELDYHEVKQALKIGATAISEATKKEKKFNKIMNKKLSEFIESEIYSAATAFALRNQKWKDDGFPEFLVNWFKV